MGKKLLALAAIGAAVYLLKTKKGEEIRKNIGKSAGEWKDKLVKLQHSYLNGKEKAHA